MKIIKLMFIISLAFSIPVYAENFQIVVHPSNPVTLLEKKALADIFLKKKVFWPDMKSILVVDLTVSSGTRREFSETVLNRPVAAVRNYWQQLLFSGRNVPPAEFQHEQDVIEFISSHEEAIGYVSGNADIGSLKAVKIQ